MIIATAASVLASMHINGSLQPTHILTCAEMYQRYRGGHTLPVQNTINAPQVSTQPNKVHIDFSNTKFLMKDGPSDTIPGTYRLECSSLLDQTWVFSQPGRLKVTATINSRGSGNFWLKTGLSVDGASRNLTLHFPLEVAEDSEFATIEYWDSSCGNKFQLDLIDLRSVRGRVSPYFSLLALDFEIVPVTAEDKECLP